MPDGEGSHEKRQRPYYEKPNRQRKLTAFGETKPVKRWVEDKRCVVSLNVVLSRLEAGYSPEDALTAVHRPYNPRFDAFGETKLLAEWQQDPRCQVTFQALYKRVKAGMPIEEALTTPLHRDLVHTRKTLITAFGETRTLNAWLNDPRCVASDGTIRKRLAAGMAPEEALTTVPVRFAQVDVSAFGETKSVREWSRDSRCVVGKETLRCRLQDGWLPEDAIAQAPRGKREQIQAFWDLEMVPGSPGPAAGPPPTPVSEDNGPISE